MIFNKNNLVLSSDDNFIQHLAVTVCSVLENRRSDYAIDIHILDGGISEENKNKIRKFISNYRNTEIKFYQIDESYFKDLPKLNESLATYYRLLIPEILPSNIDKVVYLDCDIVVNLDIKELFDIDMADYYVGAVRGREDKNMSNEDKNRRLGVNSSVEYFNAGILSINLDKWREYNLFQKSLDFAKSNSDRLIFYDQDVLNFVLQGKIYLLDIRFNYIPDDYSSDYKICNKIIHFAGPLKPWHYHYTGSNKKYYFDYLEKTPWKDFIYKDKNFINFLKKQSKLFLPRSIILFYGKIKRCVLNIK